MTKSIVPPEEMVIQFIQTAFGGVNTGSLINPEVLLAVMTHFAIQAAQWGYEECHAEYTQAMSNIIYPSLEDKAND